MFRGGTKELHESDKRCQRILTYTLWSACVNKVKHHTSSYLYTKKSITYPNANSRAYPYTNPPTAEKGRGYMHSCNGHPYTVLLIQMTLLEFTSVPGANDPGAVVYMCPRSAPRCKSDFAPTFNCKSRVADAEMAKVITSRSLQPE